MKNTETSKIAVLGGAFNPPTLAHVKLGHIAMNQLGAEQCIYLPVGDSYKKNMLISSEHRCRMLELTLKNESGCKISHIETDSNAMLTTLETLGILQSEHPESRLYFVMGSDNLRDLPNWKNPEKLLKKFYFAVLSRNDDDISEIIRDSDILYGYENRIIPLNASGLELQYISSTLIRDICREKKDSVMAIKDYVKDEVYKYIIENQLYEGGRNDETKK